MRCILGSVAILVIISNMLAANVPSETVTKEEGIYTLELAGLGFAFEDSTSDSLEVKPLTFLIKVLSKVYEPEGPNTAQGAAPVQRKALFEPSVIRLEYVSYPLEIVELSYNFFEANVYSRKVDELGHLASGEKLGKIALNLTDYTGLYGGKGRLTIGKKSYTVFLYRKEALDGFMRWINELE